MRILPFIGICIQIMVGIQIFDIQIFDMQIHTHWEGNIFKKRGFIRQFDTVDRNNLGNLAQHRALKVSAVIVVAIEEKQRW